MEIEEYIKIDEFLKNKDKDAIDKILNGLEIEELSYLVGDDVVLTDQKDNENNYLIRGYSGDLPIEAVRLREAIDYIKERFTSKQQAAPRASTISQTTRGKGRPKETFKDKLIDDVNGQKLQKIHLIMKGKKGKDFSLLILACIKKGWLNRPTHTQVTNEFGDIGSKTGYNRYLNESMYTKEELEGAINSLD